MIKKKNWIKKITNEQVSQLAKFLKEEKNHYRITRAGGPPSEYITKLMKVCVCVYSSADRQDI